MADRRRSAMVAVAMAVALAGCGGGDAVARGEATAEDLGCTSCHSTGTDDGLGPGWGGIWGTERELADGTTAVVDEAYLRRSVTQPDAQVVSGWDPIMPRVTLSDDELDDVVAYLREVTGG
ncbi:MAG: c-type cytochrome [Acidimicrobiales bacterium]